MTREEIRAIVEGVTDEQLKQILDINSADIGKAKEGAKTLQGKLDDLKTQLKEKDETITALESSKGDTDALQKELDKYKEAEAAREAERAAAEERAKLQERFKAAKGEREFSHEYIERGLFEDFSKALSDPSNAGKGDAALFTELTKDKEGVFKSQNPSVNMGGIGSNSPGEPQNLRDALREKYEPKG